MLTYIRKHLPLIILWLATLLFISYFAFYTIVRYQHIYASYFDLGIMNQAVYNTYKALTTFDFRRILEITDPFGPDQIKRMAIHNDLFLMLLAPFYIIHAGPETLLLIQAIVVGLGAIGIYGIAGHVLAKHPKKNFIALFFALFYLIYPALGRATIYEFHSVALATTFLIFFYYFWLKKKYFWSFIFLLLSLSTKEEVGLVTAFFGVYALLHRIPLKKSWFADFRKILKRIQEDKRNTTYSLTVIGVSVIWFIVSVFIIIPHFRGSKHFALQYYDDGIMSFRNAFHPSSLQYFWYLLGPLSFLPLLSPIHFLIALPELAINLFSSNANMRNIIYHYTAVITPWVFIAAIYGMRNALQFFKLKNIWLYLVALMTLTSLFFALRIGPLPLSATADTYALKYKRMEQIHIDMWAQYLKQDSIKVSASSQIAPIFTSRRYFYSFSKDYDEADYIVIRLPEVYNYPEKDQLIPIYQQLMVDSRFVKIFDKDGVVVYKKL